MLSDFFRINMPYGIKINEQNEVMVFNKEYKPLGCNNSSSLEKINEKEMFTSYKGFNDKYITKLENLGAFVQRKDERVHQIFFYNDGTNPVNKSPQKDSDWKRYFELVKLISQLKLK